jgi:DnaJ-class molecular chaperone
MKTPMLYDDETGEERALPTCWEICDACRGNGTTTRHIECDGGGFTASEWAEACYEDPDFREDYFSGVYDRACDECRGSGKVQVVDEDALSEEDRKAWDEQEQAEREIEAERWAETRYMQRGWC